MNKIHTLILTTGAIENSSNWSFIATNCKGFETLEDALVSLSTCILDPYKEHLTFMKKGCCKKVTNRKWIYCPTCGSRLAKDFLDDEASRFLDMFVRGTLDGASYSYDELENNGWVFGSNFMKFGNPFEVTTVAIFENADQYLLHAYFKRLGQPAPKRLCYNPYCVKESCEVLNGTKIKFYNSRSR